VRERRRHATLRRPLEKSLLDQERLVDVLDRVPPLAHRRGERVDPDRPAAELVDDREEERAGPLVESRLVDRRQPKPVPGLAAVEQTTRVAGHGAVDETGRAHLGEVAHATEEAVRDPRGAARAGSDLRAALVLEPGAEDRGRAAEYLLQLAPLVEVEAERRP